jgi:DNA-binding PadR family transcriptional regulator
MNAEPSSFTPLSEPTFHILLSLVAGRKHGYAILKDVELLSGERVHLSTSTLYTAISRLLDLGLIKQVDELGVETSGPGLPRKVYGVTALGRRVVEAETNRLQELAATARRRLGQEAI